MIAQLPDDLTIDAPAILMLSGPSGTGKSQTLRLLHEQGYITATNTPVDIPQDKPIIESWDVPATVAIQRLGEVGLSDPFMWCRTPAELSVGQRARLHVAHAVYSDDPFPVIDEFLTGLDRLTAHATAWSIQRAVRRLGKSLCVATCHGELADDLQPDVTITCHWSGDSRIAFCDRTREACSIMPDVEHRFGSMADWRTLKHLHYAAGEPGTVHSVHCLTHPASDTPIAVAVLSYPSLHSAARNLATDNAYQIGSDRDVARRLNREVLLLSRIVVTPELRSCGLATRLVVDILSHAPARYVECSTAMGLHTRFLTNAGFREVPQTPSTQEAELQAWASRVRVPPHAQLDPELLEDWINRLSVRQARSGRRVVWRYYHHYVLHRRTRAPVVRKIPGPLDPHWPAAYALAAQRLTLRPTYWIAGPFS